MRFYVASGLENRDFAHSVKSRLLHNGHNCAYDWTKHGDIRGISKELLEDIACSESDAVTSSELVIALLPGGKGTHTELGIALATHQNKRIIIWSEQSSVFGFGKETCAFYHHPCVEQLVSTKEQLFEFIDKL